MNKKIWILVSIIATIAIFSAVAYSLANRYDKKDTISKNSEEEKNKDALKFKEEYESLNGLINKDNDKKYRSVTIDENNPMVYADEDDIIQMMDDKETFVVYFGYNSCPWCRSVISTLIDVSNELEVSKIYYVDIHDIRDVIELDDKNKLKTTKEGTKGYYELIERLDDVLEDYTLKDKDDKKVSAKEKRIFAPNVISVVDGKAKSLTTGISDEQDDAYMKLTDKMIDDTKKMFKDVLEDVVQTSCNSKTSC